MEMVKKQAEVKPKKFSPRKRLKSEEEEKDRISGLPDCLLVEILSRLHTTKDAVITGTLSKRWKHVWTCVSNLTFHFLDDDDFQLLSNFISSIDKTLTQCRQLNLNKFQPITTYDTPFVSQINNWIRRLDITSKSIKNVIYFGYTVADYSDDRADIIEINAQYISSLAIESSLNLWKLLLVDVSSLVKADLCYKKGGYHEMTPKEAEEEMLRGFILNPRHVKELEIGEFCLKALSRLKAKGFVFPSNLKVSDVTSPEDSDDEELLYPDEWFENDSLELGEWFDSIY